jgi:4-hydroxythreonine-4-phosphate dehydrogenase
MTDNKIAALPHIAITTGEPAGVGVEVSLRAALQWHQAGHTENTPLLFISDISVLRQTAADLGLTMFFTENPALSSSPLDAPTFRVCHVPLAQPVQAGVLNVANAPYVLQLLDEAIAGIQRGDYAAMVTAPVQKSIINESPNVHEKFMGHTEYLAAQTNTKQVVMMLAGGGLRVALATTHLPLAEVPAAITAGSLHTTIEIILKDLIHKFGIAKPRLLVTGLNPHAGEGGHMGREEIDVIVPVLASFVQAGYDVRGPYPADTLFQPRYLNDADAVLAMYHDQGLPVLKYASFGHGINITLGLPIIRTSVDHGTALDLAGQYVADAGSMFAAIQAAHDMVISQKNSTKM